jgi:ABC-type phosphate transport system substrate-binding protein
MKRLRLVFLPILLAIASPSMAAGYKVIVNSSRGASEMTKQHVSDLFMKRTAQWEDGSPVVPVDLAADNPVRELFSKEVHGKAPAAVKSYWNQQVFSGRAVPPVENTTDTEVIDFVRRNKNAIGYVSDTADVSAVKVVTVK